MRVAVVGIGGAGCRVVRSLSPDLPADLVAVDTDGKELSSLPPAITAVRVGDTLSTHSSPKELREAFSHEMENLRSVLEGKDMILLICGLGGKTGAILSRFILDLSLDMNIFTIVVAIYPLKRPRGHEDGIEEGITQMKERADGVIIVDNNLKRRPEMPMLSVFNKTNHLISLLIRHIVYSIQALGPMVMSMEELLHFFYGDFFFVLTGGESPAVEEGVREAVLGIEKYAERNSVIKTLILVSLPSELSIDEMKRIASVLRDRLDPEEIKWIVTNNSRVSVLMISALSELPMIQGVELPEEIAGTSVSDFFNKQDRQDQRAAEGAQEEIQIPGPLYNRPALVGLNQKKEEPVSEEEEKKEEEGEAEDLEEVASELVGFPTFKKKGQKRLDDYKDEFGIGYI